MKSKLEVNLKAKLKPKPQPKKSESESYSKARLMGATGKLIRTNKTETTSKTNGDKQN